MEEGKGTIKQVESPHNTNAIPVYTPEQQWHAHCYTCGWQGPDRDSQQAAKADATQHQKAGKV